MRSYLKAGTWVRLPGGECYEITGTPIGEGGGSLIYPAVKKICTIDGTYVSGELNYVLKECFPVSSKYSFIRTETGEIVPESASEESELYLDTVQKMQMEEQQITGRIYNTGFRLTPIISGAVGIELSEDNEENFVRVHNAVTIMESLSNKGRALKEYLAEQRHISPVQAFRVIEQVLLAVREVHDAGYLHLDIQDGNIFIKGQLSDNSNLASLIDFGSSRSMLSDGLCAVIEDKVIFSTQGFSAPEMSRKNDGTLRLGPEADIYSIGYLLLLLLTGQKYKSYELYSNTDGHYLTKMKLRKINCPKHLEEKMQQILAKALENEPERRYHSCDEMLADVSEFVKALQPYRSDLSQVSYDAFICYKHGDIDSAAAKALQQNLEHFRSPILSGEKKKHIRRVFVDEGELSSCADFGTQIREALKNAGWLIVICSPETKSSQWVNLEIKTFLEFHDRSRILAVMTDGEPEEIFPEALLGDKEGSYEVLAADARGQDLKVVLKKLKKDALLRIAAPILGTTYDSLKQRNRVYMIQRVAAASSIAFFLLAIFTVHTLRQSAQIKEQYLQSRRNQARYLSGISLDLMKSGDREKALLTALAIEPEKDTDGPVVPEQMYALNTALNSYKDGRNIDYDPAYVGEVDGIAYGVLSQDEKYYYAIDNNDNAVVLSGDEGKLLWTITPEAIKESIENLYLYSSAEYFDKVQLVLPLSENKAAVVLKYCVAVVDVQEKNIMNSFPLEDNVSMNSEVYDQNGELFAYASTDGKLLVYDLNSGEKAAYLDLNLDCENTLTKYEINSISFNADNSSVALGLSYEYLDKSYSSFGASKEEKNDYEKASEEHFEKNVPNGIILFDLEDKEITTVSNIETVKVLFADESHVAAVHFTKPILGVELSNMWGNENYSYYKALYDISSGKQLFKGETITALDTSNIGMFTEQLEIDNKAISGLIMWIRGSLTVIDMNSGKVLGEIAYRSNIVGGSAYDKCRIFICLDDGIVQMLGLTDEIVKINILSLSVKISQYDFNSASNEIILIGDRLIFCNNTADAGMNKVQMKDYFGESFRINDIHYVELGENQYRYLPMYQESMYKNNAIAVFPVHSDECIYQYQCQEAGGNILNIGFGSYDGTDYISFVEERANGEIMFIKADIVTGETVICEDVSSYDTLKFNYTDIEYTADMNTLFVMRNSGIVRFDISGNSLIPEERAILAKTKIDEMEMTGDGRYLVLTVLDNDVNQRYVYTYNIQDHSVTELDCDIEFSGNYVHSFLISGYSSSYMCLYDGGDTICVVDCEQNRVVLNISVDNGNNYNMAFFDNDNYLILSNKNDISLYSLEQGELAYTYTNAITPLNGLDLPIITDKSNHYFALKNNSIIENSTYDTGIYNQFLYIFYVDDNHQFYPYAAVDDGYVCFSGGEISTGGLDPVFSYSGFYDYAHLKNQALEILDGKTLTVEEKLEYFIAE